MFIFKYQFLVGLSAGNTVSLINSKICKIYLVSWLPPDLHMYSRQTKLIHQHLTLLGFFPVCNILPIIGQWRFFFTSVIGPDILMKVIEGYIIFLVWTAWILFKFFILNKNKGFRSGNLLKMSPLSPFMKEFGH